MNHPRLTILTCLAVLLGVGGPGGVRGAEPAFPPAPPLPVSPVAVFRGLLAAGPEARVAELARRPARQQQALRQRLAAYDALPVTQREALLQGTDLYWHVQQLLPRAPSERSGLLAAAPAELRAVLVERLTLWDALPAADRAALLQHEPAIRYFAQSRRFVAPPLPETPGQDPASGSGGPVVPVRLQEELVRLQNLPARERQHLAETWRRFFEAPAQVRERSLESMSAAEREEMQGVLRRFRAMPATQRQACIESFTRFANMPAAERAGFLRSVASWEALSAEERATWRRLVTKLPPLPPLPTEFTPPPLPTAPPRARLLSERTPRP